MGQKRVVYALGSILKKDVWVNVTLSINALNANQNRMGRRTVVKNHRNRMIFQNLGRTAVVKETYLITMN